MIDPFCNLTDYFNVFQDVEETTIISSHGRNVFTAVESMVQLVKIQSDLGRNHKTSFSILMLIKKVQ